MKTTTSRSCSPHETLETLYRCHSREIWAMAYARWLDADLALDLVQEAFFRLWKQLQSGRQILHPQAWLLQVARNLGGDVAKCAFRRNGTQPGHFLDALAKPQQIPLEKLTLDETREQLRTEVAKMSRLDREVLTLRYALDFRTRQIANRLNMSVAAVNMRLSRARQRLLKQLAEQGIAAVS
jgi:RNA polymerase sigma-70 factor, ECF subfamily